MSVCCSVHLLWGVVFPVCLSGWVRLVESRPCVKSLPDYSLSLMTAGSSGSIRLTDVLKHRAQQSSPQSPFKQRFLPNCSTWWLHKWTEIDRCIYHGNFQREQLASEFCSYRCAIQSSLCTDLKEHSHIVISDLTVESDTCSAVCTAKVWK